MELRQLRYFTVVAKLGSISQAAQELHIAQPGNSVRTNGTRREAYRCRNAIFN